MQAWLYQSPQLTAPVLTPEAASTDGGGRKGSATHLWQHVDVTGPVLALTAISDTTSIPRLPSSVPVRKRLHASQHASWFFDVQWAAPAAVTAPDLLPMLPTMVRRRSRSLAYLAPYQPAFGVEVQVPVLSWTGAYDMRHPQWRRVRQVAAMPAYFQDTVLFPDVVVAPDLAQPVYPSMVRRTPTLRAYPQPSWPPLTVDVTTVAPPLSWRARYPDRVWPKRGQAAYLQDAFEMWPSPVPVIAVSHLSGGRGYYVVPGRARTFTVPPHKRRFTVS